ncbi:MAG: hypothetical protein KKF48_01095 [Nanoarchaeota archaeon]|nr:hypothetical protein [Nanoarchaeota archaeon]MBU1027619.1 hypothetical protein [Nanoarchaeota archaeon]
MKRVDYNIEYAHVYSDEEGLSDEQLRSIEVVKKLVKKLEKQGKTYVLTFLIDEYHPEYHKLNFHSYMDKLAKLGASPTYVGYESRMISAAKLLIKSIPKDFTKTPKFHPTIKVKEGNSYLKINNKKIKLKTQGKMVHLSRYTCAVLSTAWALLRMGLVQSKNAVELTGLTEPKPFAGKKIINVLDRKYAPVEEANKDIIKSSKFKDQIKNFETLLY